MKIMIKQHSKKILAVLLVLVVLVTSVSRWNNFVKASDTGYREMKFSDWEMTQEEIDGLDIFRPGNANTIVDLDGVAITGVINFNGATWSRIAIGGTETAKAGGFWLVYSGGSLLVGSNQIGTELVWKSLDGTSASHGNRNVKLRVTFDKAEQTNDWTVNLYVDDTHVGAFVYEGVIPGTYLAVHKSLTVTDWVEEVPEEYHNLSFTDWSVSEGSLYGVDIYSLNAEQKITSLDHVAVSGKVNFHNDTSTYFRIGGTKENGDNRHAGFRIGTVDGGLGLWPQAIGGNGANNNILPKADWEKLIKEEFILRLEFDKNDNTGAWTVTVYINEEEKGTYNCGAVTPGLYLGNVGVTIKALDEEVIPYTELTFGDWGISEGKLYGFDIYSLTDKTKAVSLDRTVVSGTVNFNGDSDAYFRIGGFKNDTSDARHAGFSIMTQSNTGRLIIWPQGIGDGIATVILEAKEWEALIQTDMSLRMTFDRQSITGMWTVTVAVNGEEKVSYECGTVTPGMYIANAGVTIDGLGKINIEDLNIPDIYNPPTEMRGETEVGNYITSVAKQGETTVISAADTDNGYVANTNYKDYKLDYVLDFDVERELRVLQLTDTQTIDSAQSRYEGRLPWQSHMDAWAPEEMYNNLFRYIIKTVREAKPDLILITGDVIYGEFDDNGTSLIALIQCMDSLKIPWAPIFGNHENESDMGVEWQCQQFEKSTYCLFNRRHEIGGNGNYSIGLSKKGELSRVIYMMDNNGCAYSSDFNGEEVKTSFGFTDRQKEWYENTAKNVNTVAGKKMPSFLCYHAPTLEMHEAVVAAGYQKADSEDTYTLGVDVINVQNGDSGTKGGKRVYTYDEDGLVEIMKAVGTDGAFFGHEHLNSLSVLYKGIRWTYGLKTGTYDSTPSEVGGTLITLDSGSNAFDVEQIATNTAEMDSLYPRVTYTLPKAPENPNKEVEGKEYVEMHFSDWGKAEGSMERTDCTLDFYSPSKKLKSLDGIAISGKVNFSGKAWYWLTVGGTTDIKDGGFWLAAIEENGWAMACQGIGTNYADQVKWSTAAKFAEEVGLRITFDKAKDSNAWTVVAYADGIKVGRRIYKNVNPGTIIGVPRGVTVEGIEAQKEIEPILSDKFKEISFSDFGMYSGEVEKASIYNLKEKGYIKSLDGVAISGKVNFNNTKDGRISIGGTEQLKQAGFWLFTDGKTLRLSPQGIGSQTVDHFLLWEDDWKKLKNQDIDLRLTFSKAKNTGDWWIGVHINGTHIGTYNCKKASPGLYLGVYSNLDVEGLGDAVKKASLDFTLFGYSNKNWREEMGMD